MKFTKRELDQIEERKFRLHLYNQDWSWEKCYARALFEVEMDKLTRLEGKVTVRQVGLLET